MVIKNKINTQQIINVFVDEYIKDKDSNKDHYIAAVNYFKRFRNDDNYFIILEGNEDELTLINKKLQL